MSKRRTLLSEVELKIAIKSTYVSTDEEALNLFYTDCQLRNLYDYGNATSRTESHHHKR
ncbi:hypothetical protein [Bacillus cereus]|uniref:hypothetical protein n=1 Tax=Bacillus cereus TaxID=1396 RepID=UPI001E508AB3|nr:hypothetical protein [Bacillus cereus]